MGVFEIILIIAGVLLTGVGGLIWWLNSKSWNIRFHLVTSQGLKEVKGKRITSKTNKSQRFFVFKNNTTKLHIKEPNGYYNGKPTRFITYSPNGDYVYLESFEPDKNNYLKYSLEPEERELSLWRFQENQKSYGSVDKMAIASLFTNIALVVIIAIAVIYSVISFTKNADTFAEIAKNNRETVSEMNGQITAIERISEYQMIIMQNLNSDFDGESIVRTLS